MELAGEPLKDRHVRAADTSLHYRALQHFGSWTAALEAAGIDSEAVSRRRTWTVQRIVAAVHRLNRQGVPLNYGAVYKMDSGLAQAGAKLLGSWDETLRAAGYDPASIRSRRRPWRRDQILNLIRRRHAAGLPIAAHNVVPQSAEVASRRLFGSWRAALKAAGVPNPSRSHPIWTKVSVVEGILARQLAGEPIYAYAVAQHASRLYDAARRHFGSWREALAVAGIAPEQVQRRHSPYTKAEILDHLRQSAEKCENYRLASQHPEPIVKAARWLFGSWHKTLQAAGEGVEASGLV
ncbi:MAG: hypothetical protein KGY81_07565 [Phycisphaerae bacterium]|nr:hypothetical protein [Phycisphaerae bacterium]